MKRMVFAAAAIVAVSNSQCSREGRDGAAEVPDTIAVSVVQVAPTEFTVYGTYYGTTEPALDATIICYAGGRVDRILAREGDLVVKGASLARIDGSRAASMLESTKLQEELARWTYEQTEVHFNNGNASRFELDQAHLAYIGAQSNRIEAQKNYRGAFAISPMAGIVTQRFVDVHQEVAPGTPVFEVAQLDTMRIVVAVPPSDVILVEPGARAVITSDLLTGRTWSGELRFLSRQASAQSRAFNAEVFVANSDLSLKAGVATNVKMVLRSLSDQIVIPSYALNNEGLGNSAMIVDSAGIARKRIVQTGPQRDSLVVIREGLGKGDCLIVAGQQLVSDGTPVRIKGHQERRGRDDQVSRR